MRTHTQPHGLFIGIPGSGHAMRTLLLLIATLLLPTVVTGAADQPPSVLSHPDSAAFIDRMVGEYDFDRGQLQSLFGAAHMRPSVIERITRPAEAKPWYQYRKIFLGERRINDGAAFWNAHAATLARAEAEFGVAAEVVVAIIGVETLYGHYRGKDPVLESLATLAFDYPKRGKFFGGELEQYLLLARDEDWDPLTIKGSYAGAMGLPQFIPSSYRRLAIDFDGDGHRDLIDNPADAIGSVAWYLKKSGWQPGQTIAAPASVRGDNWRAVERKGLKPATAVSALGAAGIRARTPVTATSAALVTMEGAKGPEHWLGFDNFYAITRYNHSPLYALAVFQLSEEIRDAYLQPQKKLDRVERTQMAKLQRLLQDAGHDPGPVDGLDGPQTRAAMASARRATGLGAGDTADSDLIKALVK